MNCPQCNELNESDALFCHNCGTKLSAQPIVKPQKVPNPPPQDTSSPIGKIVFILLILGIAGLGAYMLFFNVPTPVISLVPNTANVTEGETINLTLKVEPEKAARRLNFNWTSSNENVATVIGNGIVTGISAGNATIVVTSTKGNIAPATATVTVQIPVASISLTPSYLTLNVGQTSRPLTATVLPANAGKKDLEWSSDRVSVATVNNGVVTAIGVGTASITVKSTDGSNKSATVTVEVNNIPITVSLNRSTISLNLNNNRTGTLTANVQPATVPNREVLWSSSNPSVATVSNGNITALQTGSATIRAIAVADENKFAECIVNVEGDVVINYPFGRYEGRVSNGIPNGQGTMRYTCRIQIARHGSATYFAENGDVLSGTWANGDISNGNLRDRNGNQKAAILAGRRQSPHNLNNDRCQ